MRDGIEHDAIPATGLAAENGLEGMANVIILGYLLKLTGLFEYDAFLEHMIARDTGKQGGSCREEQEGARARVQFCKVSVYGCRSADNRLALFLI